MTKRERSELNRLLQAAEMGIACKELGMVGYAARGISALIRATRTDSNRNVMITIASGFPAVVQHPEFIVS